MPLPSLLFSFGIRRLDELPQKLQVILFLHPSLLHMYMSASVSAYMWVVAISNYYFRFSNFCNGTRQMHTFKSTKKRRIYYSITSLFFTLSPFWPSLSPSEHFTPRWKDSRWRRRLEWSLPRAHLRLPFARKTKGRGERHVVHFWHEERQQERERERHLG